MGFVSPTTKSNGDGLTAADWNTYVRDNTAFLHAPPRCSIVNSGNQSIPNAADTDLTFDTEEYDTDTMHSTVTNQERIVAKTAGVYLVSCGVEFAANTTGSRQVKITVNNASVVGYQNTTSTLNNVVVRLNVAAQIYMDVDDYVKAVVYQDSAGSLNVVAANGTPFFRAVWIGG